MLLNWIPWWPKKKTEKKEKDLIDKAYEAANKIDTTLDKIIENTTPPKVEEPPKKKQFNRLWIHTVTEQFGWQVPWEGGKKGQVTPWKGFFKWYFGRNSEVYAFPYDKGITAILRSEIKSFGIQIVDELPLPPEPPPTRKIKEGSKIFHKLKRR